MNLSTRWQRSRALLASATVLVMACAAVSSPGSGPSAEAGNTVAMPLESGEGLELLGARAEPVAYQGRRALRLEPLEGATPGRASLAIVHDLQLADGEIDLEVAGAPRPGERADMRGFVGLAFHVSPDGSRYENFYLRPTNGRADDQLRRNHAVQYQSSPDFSWKRLRDESPGQYESYVDVQPGVWTRMRVTVSGTRAELYVDGAEQPCLIVRDLRLGATGGGVALWTDPTTEAYFRNLRVRRAR